MDELITSLIILVFSLSIIAVVSVLFIETIQTSAQQMEQDSLRLNNIIIEYRIINQHETNSIIEFYIDSLIDEIIFLCDYDIPDDKRYLNLSINDATDAIERMNVSGTDFNIGSNWTKAYSVDEGNNSLIENDGTLDRYSVKLIDGRKIVRYYSNANPACNTVGENYKKIILFDKYSRVFELVRYG